MVLHLTEILIFSSLVLLSFVILTNPLKVNTKGNFWFGFFLLLWATFGLDEILYLTGNINLKGTTLKVIITFVQFLTPLILYISIIFFTNPNFKFKTAGITYLILPILYLITQIVEVITYTDLQLILLSLILVHSLFYTIKSYLKIKEHQKKIKQFSSSVIEIDLKWLEYIIVVILIMVVVISIFNIIYYKLPLDIYINLIMLGIIFIIAYNVLKQKEIFPLNEEHREEVLMINEDKKDISTKRKILKDHELLDFKSQLNGLMKENQLYLNPEINVASLSEHMQITTHQLSYIINNGFNQNFFQFINGYRVEKAKSLLLDESSDNLSILGIAFESGFSSKTAFNTTFKKITNQTPSEFKKQRSGL